MSETTPHAAALSGREGQQATPPFELIAYRLQPSNMRIIPSPADRRWMDSNRNGANRCLPLRVANQAGWLVLNDSEFEVSWNGKPYPKSLRVKYAHGQKPRFVSSIFGFGILTFHIPYLFRTPSGWNLLARGPANWIKDGISPLEGLVETDWAVASFTMNWKFQFPFWKVKFRKNEPICMIVPQRRRGLEGFEPQIRNIESNPELHREFKQWSETRNAFIKEKRVFIEEKMKGLHPNKEAPWQPEYTHGVTLGGKRAPEHQVKLHLKPFVDLEGLPPGACDEDVALPPDDADPEREPLWSRIRRLWKKEP